MKASFYFANSQILESAIVKSSFKVQEILYNELKSADGSCSFTIPFDVRIANAIKTQLSDESTENIKIQVTENDEAVFTGYLQKNLSFEKTQQNQPIKITVINPSYFLDVKATKNIMIKNETVSSVIKKVIKEFTQWENFHQDDEENSDEYEPTETTPIFIMKADENVKGAIQQLCYEFGCTFYFDKNGLLKFRPLFVENISENEIQYHLDGSNIREKISIQAKEDKYNLIRASYNEVKRFYAKDWEEKLNVDYEEEENERLIVFNDTSEHKIDAGHFFADEFCNYLDYDSEKGKVLYAKYSAGNYSGPVALSTSGISATSKEDDFKTSAVTDYMGDKDTDGTTLVNQARLSLYNGTDKAITINKVYVNATEVYAETTVCESVAGTGTKEKAEQLKYVQRKTQADYFAKNLLNYYNYCNFTIQLKSQVEIPLGDFVTVEDYQTGKFTGRVTSKEYSLSSKSFSYKIETVQDYEPCEETTTSKKHTGNNPQVSIQIEKEVADKMQTAIEEGIDVRMLMLGTNSSVIKKDENGNYTPEILTVKGIKKGPSSQETFSALFKIFAVDDEGNRTLIAENESPESSISVDILQTLQANELEESTMSFYVSMRNIDGTEIDVQTVPIIKDGSDGITVFLKDRFQTYPCNADGIVIEKIIETEVIAYKGTKRIECAVGDIVPPQGFEIECLSMDRIRIKGFSSDSVEMANKGEIEIPVFVKAKETGIELISAGTKDAGDVLGDVDGIAFGGYEFLDEPIILYFGYQKIHSVASYTAEQLERKIPQYLGCFDDVPTKRKTGDWFLYSGESTGTLRTGYVYIFNGATWVQDESAEHLNATLSDMLTINREVQALQGTPTEAWLNKLVTNDAFIDRLMANNAFIDKLASRVITLQDEIKNGQIVSRGIIKSSNYDGITDEEKWYREHLTRHGYYCLNPRGTYTINVDDMFLESEYEPHYLGEFENLYAAEKSTDNLHLGDWYYDTTGQCYIQFHIYDDNRIVPRRIGDPQKISTEATQGFKIDTQGNADFMNDVRIGGNVNITGNTLISGNAYFQGYLKQGLNFYVLGVFRFYKGRCYSNCEDETYKDKFSTGEFYNKKSIKIERGSLYAGVGVTEQSFFNNRIIIPMVHPSMSKRQEFNICRGLNFKDIFNYDGSVETIYYDEFYAKNGSEYVDLDVLDFFIILCSEETDYLY